MKKRKDFFGKGEEVIRGVKWDWEKFKTTEGFPVSDKLIDWLIGQDRALKEAKLCLYEWINKLKQINKEKLYADWEDPKKEKPVFKQRLTPGPYLLLLGDPGTGKSLLGRALSEILTELYKKNNIKLYDILCWPNSLIPSQPLISIHPSPSGKDLVRQKQKEEARKNRWKRILIKVLQLFIMGLGASLLFVALYWLFVPWIFNWMTRWGMTIQELYHYSFFDYLMQTFPNVSPMLVAGGSLFFTGFFIYWIGRFLGGNLFRGGVSIGGAQQSQAPKLLVDNSSGKAPFIDATGHGSSQLFGSIAWDPLQTGGLGTPEHQRVTAGDVHRAHMGILYIDEIKNLKPLEAITLLTVLEDGQIPITLRGYFHGGETAAMAVSTQPVPSLVFLVGAGNLDSVGQIHPALMDRILGYGKIVKMNNKMKNTVKNRRKYVQFIAQECKRFNVKPFTREACIELIEEARRRSGERNALTCKFRPMISIIKTAGVLADLDGSKYVRPEHVRKAIEEHCKTVERQLLEEIIEQDKKYLEIEPKGLKKGIVYGLSVISKGGEEIGAPLRVKAQLVKVKKGQEGYFEVTGVRKNAKYMPGSIKKVKSVIFKKYGVDLASEYATHIDFSQDYFVDGPSAGVTMTVAIASILENKKIRQDTAITGEINISEEGEIEVTPVGGIHAKIKAAEAFGFSRVIIPYKNYLHSINPSDYKIKVIPGRTLDDYLKELLVDENGKGKDKTK